MLGNSKSIISRTTDSDQSPEILCIICSVNILMVGQDRVSLMTFVYANPGVLVLEDSFFATECRVLEVGSSSNRKWRISV